MRRDKIIYLVSEEKQDENEYGDPITIPGEERKVFATEKSITRNEFYQAAVSDFRPDLNFEIWLHEYNNEKNIRYEGNLYNIIRTYKTDEKNIELVCQGLST